MAGNTWADSRVCMVTWLAVVGPRCDRLGCVRPSETPSAEAPLARKFLLVDGSWNGVAPVSFGPSRCQFRVGAQRVDEASGYARVSIAAPRRSPCTGREVVQHELAAPRDRLRVRLMEILFSIFRRQRPSYGRRATSRRRKPHAPRDTANSPSYRTRPAPASHDNEPVAAGVTTPESCPRTLTIAVASIAHRPDCVVNWRMLEKPAANSTSPNVSAVVSISTRAVGLRWAAGQRQWVRTDLGLQACRSSWSGRVGAQPPALRRHPRGHRDRRR